METSIIQSDFCSRSAAQELENELLAEIFSYLCCDPIDLGSPSAPVLDLQQVCTHWRTVVRSTPWLWATYKIETWAPRPVIMRRMDTCLQLSGSTLITVDLISLCMFPGPSKHSDRWGTLYATGSAINAIVDRPELHNAIKQRGLGRLRKLILGGLDSDSPYLFDFFHSATDLQDVKISQIETDVDTSNFPWAGLKRLEMSDCHFSGDNNVSFFRSLSSLEELVWTGNLIPLSSLPQGLVVPLPALHSVMIDDHGYKRVNNVPLQWNLFRTPALTNVHLINDMPHFEHLSSMILTSSGVKTLQLELCTTAFIREVAQLLPSVEEFTITDPKKLDDALTELVWDPSRKNNLLPSLRKLSVKSCSEDLRMIKSDDNCSVTTLMERLKSHLITYSDNSIRTSSYLLKLLSSRTLHGIANDCQKPSNLPTSPLTSVNLHSAQFPQYYMRLLARAEM